MECGKKLHLLVALLHDLIQTHRTGVVKIYYPHLATGRAYMGDMAAGQLHIEKDLGTTWTDETRPDRNHERKEQRKRGKTWLEE
ncbi:hypothetical protein TNCV_642971 [Trichonephila clavipes]|nr:hypothetical protein TNCV_642971 [Trichonephila clavipes]